MIQSGVWARTAASAEFEHALELPDGGGADQPGTALRGLAFQEDVLDAVRHDVDSPGRRAVQFLHQVRLPLRHATQASAMR